MQWAGLAWDLKLPADLAGRPEVRVIDNLASPARAQLIAPERI